MLSRLSWKNHSFKDPELLLMGMITCPPQFLLELLGYLRRKWGLMCNQSSIFATTVESLQTGHDVKVFFCNVVVEGAMLVYYGCEVPTQFLRFLTILTINTVIVQNFPDQLELAVVAHALQTVARNLPYVLIYLQYKEVKPSST